VQEKQENKCKSPKKKKKRPAEASVSRPSFFESSFAVSKRGENKCRRAYAWTFLLLVRVPRTNLPAHRRKTQKYGKPKIKKQKSSLWVFSFSWGYAPDGTGCIKNKILRKKKVLKI
jgi:hypothetical protein